MSNRASQAITRPGRTAGQMGLSAALVEFADAFDLFDFDGRQYAAAVVLLGLVVGFVQVVLENRGVIPALGRSVPPDDAPVIDHADTPAKGKVFKADGGRLGLDYLARVLVVLGVVVILVDVIAASVAGLIVLGAVLILVGLILAVL